MEAALKIELAKMVKPKPDPAKLGFGTYTTDHMFKMDYTEEGWHDPRIVPYQPITLDPAAKVFHYGQTVFEGMKAYRSADNRILLFRPQKNFQRLNRSNARLSIPSIDEDFALQALKALIRIDEAWVPSAADTSLYIRPFIIATQPSLGASISTQYQFIMILSPVGPYYAEGIQPVSIHVETGHVRAVRGGLGTAKTGGNYAAGLKAQVEAAKNGYAQVLWLDGIHRKYIEEVGSMNVFFKIGEKVLTPALNGSILDGVVRDSVLRLLASWQIPVEEREIALEELYGYVENGTLEEAFGTGTAAAVSPISELNWMGRKIRIHGGTIGRLADKLFQTLTGIQRGAVEDPYGWTVDVRN